MSKYRNRSFENKKTEVVNEDKIEEVVNEDKIEEVVNEDKIEEVVNGMSCSRLNIRIEPNIESKSIAIIDKDTKVKIDKKKTVNDWYSVTTVHGVTGYCMSKFIIIND